jgi:uncharacterized RDD family membrane protein YckC
VTTYQTMSDPTSVMGKRIGAYIVDSILGLAIFLAIFAATVEETTVGFNPCDDPVGDGYQGCMVDDFFVVWDGEEATAYDLGDGAIAWIAGAGYAVLVYVIWQGLSGMTPGKALFGIRTVGEDGNVPGIGRAFVRTILWVVDGIGCGVPLVGPIAAFTSKGHRRVGDMAAKTYVVGKSSLGAGPVVIPGMTPPSTGAPFGSPGYGATQPGWGTTPPGMPVTPPGMPTTPVATAPTEAPAAPPAAGEPQWDAARNAYIQWDAGQQKWLQFDDATQQWRPID